ncbi:MAG TPA: hypothetical protein P5081_01275 [Phycisphaerae bacterium]|nr:hypothetical protein [Phycisphaerae bacterium]HRW51485.1 hypothetical protein [Phycisphaerae bacterium]
MATLASGTLSFQWALNRRRRLVRRNSAWRYDRLCRVAAHPEAKARLPHRVIEHACFGSIPLDRVRRRWLPDLPPGHVIILLDRSDERTPIFDPIDTAFEPIQLGRDVERVNWLTCVCDPEAQTLIDNNNLRMTSSFFFLDFTHHKEKQRHERGDRHRAKGAFCRKLIRSRPVQLVSIALLLMCALHEIVKTLLGASALRWLFPVAAILSLVLIARFVRDRTIFFIPGGLAERTTFFAGRRATVRRFTSADASIIVTMPFTSMMLTPLTHVLRGAEKPCTMSTPLNALLTAWTATAPTPTPMQLEMVLNPSA